MLEYDGKVFFSFYSFIRLDKCCEILRKGQKVTNNQISTLIKTWKKICCVPAPGGQNIKLSCGKQMINHVGFCRQFTVTQRVFLYLYKKIRPHEQKITIILCVPSDIFVLLWKFLFNSRKWRRTRKKIVQLTSLIW